MAAKQILLADDLSGSTKAARSRSHLLRDLAAEMARRLNDPLKIVYCAETPKYFHTKSAALKIKEQTRRSLFELEEEMSHYPVISKTVVLEGDPVEGVLAQEDEQGPLEMVILGAQGKTGLHKALIGSVSEEVLRQSHVPVMILGPEARANKFELPYEDSLRILVLTDLSPASIPAEEYAASLAFRLKAKLTLCHSVGHQILHLKEMLYSRRVTTGFIDQMFREMREDSDKMLRKRVQQLQRRGVDVGSILLMDEKNLEDIVPKKIGDACDLIVMGTHSRGKFMTAVVGSSARNLILNSPVPVVICRSYAH